jgi:hypothetical protein
MPCTIARDEDLDVTRIAFKGQVDQAGLLEGVRSARSLPGHSYRTLMVVSTDTDLQLSSSDLRQIARALRVERSDDAPRGRTAVVAPTDLAFGLARMTQVFMEEGPAEVRVFHSEEDALAWLAGA